jgi:hypothetical protein
LVNSVLEDTERRVKKKQQTENEFWRSGRCLNSKLLRTDLYTHKDMTREKEQQEDKNKKEGMRRRRARRMRRRIKILPVFVSSHLCWLPVGRSS